MITTTPAIPNPMDPEMILPDTEYRLSIRLIPTLTSNAIKADNNLTSRLSLDSTTPLPSNSDPNSNSTSTSNANPTPTPYGPSLKAEFTPDQRRRVDRHLAGLRGGWEGGRGRDGSGGRGRADEAGAGGAGEDVSHGKRGPMVVPGPTDSDDKAQQDRAGPQGKQGVAHEAIDGQGSTTSSFSPFIPSRRKRRAIPFPSNGSGPGLDGNNQVAGPSSSSSTSTSTSSPTSSPTTTVQSRGSSDDNGYTLILRGCMDGRWKGEGNYRCTRVWPGKEGSSVALHSRAAIHAAANTSRSSHGNKKSSTPTTHSARTRPKRGASSTRASESAATSAAARAKGAESAAPSSATGGSTSGGKPLLVVPGLTTGPSPSPLRMAYSQPNSPEEGISAQSLSTLDVSRVLRASSESGLGVGDSVGGGKKRRRGSAMEESTTSGLDPTDLGGRLETRSASSPPAKKVARSGLGGNVMASGVGLGVTGVRVSPRLSHAVPVIPDDMKATPQTNAQRDERPDAEEIADPMTLSGKRYTELSEQDKEEFRATWPLEALSTEEWDRRTNGEWSRLSDADRTTLEETTNQDRRRTIFAHLDQGQPSGSPLVASQTTSGSSSDLGRALLKRELEAKKRLEGRAATCSPPRMAGGENEPGGSMDQDVVDGSEDGKRSSVGGTSMRRTLSHDTATLTRPRAPSRRGSSEVEPPVSMASSRSRREVGPPRHLRDYETEIAV